MLLSLVFLIEISNLNTGFFPSQDLLDWRKWRHFLWSLPVVKPGLLEIYIGFSSLSHSLVTSDLRLPPWRFIFLKDYPEEVYLKPKTPGCALLFDPRFLPIMRPSIRQSTASTTWGRLLHPSWSIVHTSKVSSKTLEATPIRTHQVTHPWALPLTLSSSAIGPFGNFHFDFIWKYYILISNFCSADVIESM